MTSSCGEFIVEDRAESLAIFGGLAAYLFQRVTPETAPGTPSKGNDPSSPVFESRFAGSLAPLTPLAPSYAALSWLAQFNYRCCLSTTSLVAAVYYLETLLYTGRLRLTDSSWRAAFVAAAIAAEQMHEDNFVHPTFIANTFSRKVPAKLVAEMQTFIVFALDWRMTVPPAEFHRLREAAIALGTPLLPHLPEQVFRDRPVPAELKPAQTRDELLAAQRSSARFAPSALAHAESASTVDHSGQLDVCYETPMRATNAWAASTNSVSTMDADTPLARDRTSSTPFEQCPFAQQVVAQ